MIAILDYGSGNIRSVQRACETTGEEVVITSDRNVAIGADGLVVPGVGAFAACINSLRAIGGDEIIQTRIATNKPTLGICVGMQILFCNSDEDDRHAQGLNYIPTTVKRLEAPVLPQIGWNTVKATQDSRLFSGISNERFYFVHSYAATEADLESKVTTSEYGSRFLAAIEKGPISAVQFHPEKSGDAGLRLIKNWSETL